MNCELRIFDNIESLSKEAAQFIYVETVRLLESKARADVILAGGKTPAKCYKQLSSLLASGGRRISGINWLLGDERWLPTSDPDSNERMIRETLLPIHGKTMGTFYSWKPCERSRYVTAVEYGHTIDFLSDKGKKEPDILLLGLGNDGHTASLFPGSLILHENGELVPLTPTEQRHAITLYVPLKKMWRLSLTPGFLNTAALTIFLVSGPEKKEAFSRLLECADSSQPACWIKGKKIIYFVTSEVLPEKALAGRSLPARVGLE